MSDRSKDPDREILRPKSAFRPGDPEQNLTDEEIDRLLRHFAASPNSGDPMLRNSLKMQFQWFYTMALEEGFRERNGALETVPKPSTIEKSEMQQLAKACEVLDKRLSSLDIATKSWLDQFLEERGIKTETGQRFRLRHLEEQISWPIDLLIFAARSAESNTSRGPNKISLRIMIEKLAECWEVAYGTPPTTDNGANRGEDRFRNLCQEMAGFAQTRVKDKGGKIGANQLSGLVRDVLKIRRSKSFGDPQEK